jgi:hypothetical protein
LRSVIACFFSPPHCSNQINREAIASAAAAGCRQLRGTSDG